MRPGKLRVGTPVDEAALQGLVLAAYLVTQAHMATRRAG
jgi:hypothetical protein